MLKLLLILFYLSGVTVNGSTMVALYGKANNNDLAAAGFSVPLNICIDACLGDPGCFLALMDSNGYCLTYGYSPKLLINVTETTNSDGFYVAFKVTQTLETCPTSYDSIDFSGSTDTDSYRWTRTATGWAMANPCPESWKKFERDDSSTVCMKAFHFDSVQGRDYCKELCASKGHKMAGVGSVQELLWMRDEVLSKSNEGVYWVGGVKTPDCQFSRNATCQDFDWSDDYTTGNTASLLPYGNLNVDPYFLISAKSSQLDVIFTNAIYNTNVNGVFCGFQAMP